jgi:hypothetical protein
MMTATVKMKDQSDNAAVPSRTTVRIPTASGDELEARVYLLCESMRTAILPRAVADLCLVRRTTRVCK